MIPEDRLFEPVRDLLIILSAVAHASFLMTVGSTHKIKKPVMRVGTRWPDYSLAIPLGGPLQRALRGKNLTSIHIGILTDATANSKAIPNPRFHTSGLHPVVAQVIAPIFLMFFERYNLWLNQTNGRDSAENWHPTLNFARVICNAAAHGSIQFRDPNALPVSWRDLTYSPADNGKSVVGVQMQLGEMLALMFETDDVLTKIDAPILLRTR